METPLFMNKLVMRSLIAWFKVMTVFTLFSVMAYMLWITLNDHASTPTNRMSDQGSYYADSTRNWVHCHVGALPGKPVLVRSVTWFDNRSAVKDTPCLRLHILYPNVTTITSAAIISSNASITGMLWYRPSFPSRALDKFDFHSLHSGKKFYAYSVQYTEALITFRLDKRNSKPYQLSLSVENCEIPTNIIKIKQAPLVNKKRDFGVCVLPLYGHREDSYAPLFIEWVETLRMFGVEQFHIYNCSMTLSHRVQRAFDYYTKQSILVVHQFQTPFTLAEKNQDPGYTCAGIQQKAAFSDCLYGNMNKFRFLILLDPDEIIVPYKGHTYNRMLEYIAEIHPAALKGSSISYLMKFFFLKEAPYINKNESLLSLRYTAYVSTHQISGKKQTHSKSFVFPERCIYAYSHGCIYSQFERYFAHTKYGNTHHYRSSCDAAYKGGTMARFESRCHVFEERYRNETRMFRFKQAIMQRLAEDGNRE